MKVTIEIDCTPLEARTFMGLPDVQPMQAAVLAEIERRLMAEAEKFSPEGLMQAWFSAVPRGADWVRDMLGGLAKAAASGTRADTATSPKKD
jgi:hypothetical protein